MACYWGAETKTAKVVWGIVCILATTGIVLVSAGLIGGYTGDKCLKFYRDCQNRPGSDSKQCLELADQRCAVRKWLALISAGIIIWAIGVACTCYFCCCASRPERNDLVATSISMQPYPSGGVPQMLYQYPSGNYTSAYHHAPGAYPQTHGPGGPTLVQGMPVTGIPVPPPHGTAPAIPMYYYYPQQGQATAPQQPLAAGAGPTAEPALTPAGTQQQPSAGPSNPSALASAYSKTG